MTSPEDQVLRDEQRRAQEEALIAERNAAQREAGGSEQPLVLRGEGDAAAQPTTESVEPPPALRDEGGEDEADGGAGEGTRGMDDAAVERDAEWGTGG